MPIVQREPTIVKREIRLEQPVNELLDDYAKFIESRPDHVVNSVLKKMLSKDRDYKRWRSQRTSAETPSLAARKASV
ncbi:MAG: hypothetical protein WBL70_01230 [Candidatus Acidiferrales bacterium]